MLTWKGNTQCISAWAEELNVPRHLFDDRLKLGWSTEKFFQRIFEDKGIVSTTKPILDLEDWLTTVSGTPDDPSEKQSLLTPLGLLSYPDIMDTPCTTCSSIGADRYPLRGLSITPLKKYRGTCQSAWVDTITRSGLSETELRLTFAQAVIHQAVGATS